MIHSHAAALTVGGRGLLIAGEKAAGKTTTLTYLLRSGRARYVANDRVHISVTPQGIRLRGMPSVVTMRGSTVDLFPDLESCLLRSGYSQRLTLAEAATQPPGSVEPWPDGRFGMSPAQSCELVGADAVAGCDATMLIFPRVNDDPGRLLPLSPAAAASSLEPTLLCAGAWRKTSDLFVLPRTRALDESRLRHLCEEIGRRVPCFECPVGRDTLANRRLADAIFNALGRSAPVSALGVV